jgi:hypothetical protein
LKEGLGVGHFALPQPSSDRSNAATSVDELQPPASALMRFMVRDVSAAR